MSLVPVHYILLGFSDYQNHEEEDLRHHRMTEQY